MMTKIALVEDQKLFRSLLTPWINSIDGCYVIMEAAHGKEFIEKLEQNGKPDLVILDLNMHVMDGFETATWLYRNHPEIPILVLTTLASDIAMLRLVRKGIRGFIIKDELSASELKGAISTVMETGYYYTGGKFFQLLRNIDSSSPWTLGNIITEVEMKFLRLACSAMTYRAIATEMGVSPRTVDGYRESLFGKLKVSTRVELALFCVKHGIVII